MGKRSLTAALSVKLYGIIIPLLNFSASFHLVTSQFSKLIHLFYLFIIYFILKHLSSNLLHHLPLWLCNDRKSQYQMISDYRVFLPSWPVSMQIYWNKRKHLNKKRVQLQQNWLGTPTWLSWHHVQTLYSMLLQIVFPVFNSMVFLDTVRCLLFIF